MPFKGKNFLIFYVITILDEIGESELTLRTNSLQPHSKTGYASGIPRIIPFRKWQVKKPSNMYGATEKKKCLLSLQWMKNYQWFFYGETE